MRTILVKQGAHGPCATEENPRRYITDKPVQVNETSYYLRRISDGDLVLVEEDDVGEASAKKKGSK